MYFFFSLASFPTFLRSALREQRLNFFRFGRTLVFLKYLYNTVRSRAKSMGYVITCTCMCTRDQEIEIHSRIYFLRIASRSAKFAKFESIENYALYGIFYLTVMYYVSKYIVHVLCKQCSYTNCYFYLSVSGLLYKPPLIMSVLIFISPCSNDVSSVRDLGETAKL